MLHFTSQDKKSAKNFKGMNVPAKISAVIVDDEEISRRRVRRFLKNHPYVELAGEAHNVATAEELIQRSHPDLLFLDIQLPGRDAFALLEQMDPEDRPCTIFITAHEEHAVHAFEVQAVDYLLKPFDQRRFDQAVRRACRKIRHPESAGKSEFAEMLAVHDRGQILLLRVGEIRWIEAKGHYCLLHTSQGEYMVREGIQALHSRLDPEKFLRIHRSTLVHVDQIHRMQPLFHGDYRVILQNGTQLVLSRGFKHLLRRILRDRSL